MAHRPVFIPNLKGRALVATRMVEFRWFAGMSVKQKQRSVASLHEAATRLGLDRLLEISTKSEDEKGVALSAFNLGFESQKNGRRFTVESVFQGSKVFEEGGPYIDLYKAHPKEAKRDDRLTSSGRLIGFCFFREPWPLEPKTAFYDWVYINTLQKNPELADALLSYQAFTDIEFNPERSINCQAYSAALYCSLVKRSLLDDAVSSQQNFIDIVSVAQEAGPQAIPEQPVLNL